MAKKNIIYTNIYSFEKYIFNVFKNKPKKKPKLIIIIPKCLKGPARTFWNTKLTFNKKRIVKLKGI